MLVLVHLRLKSWVRLVWSLWQPLITLIYLFIPLLFSPVRGHGWLDLAPGSTECVLLCWGMVTQRTPGKRDSTESDGVKSIQVSWEAFLSSMNPFRESDADTTQPPCRQPVSLKAADCGPQDFIDKQCKRLAAWAERSVPFAVKPVISITLLCAR